MEETFHCSICIAEHPISERTEFDGQELCDHCLAEETEICTVCGERIWSDNNAGNSDIPLCQSCYDRHYCSCIRCGALVHNDDANYAHDDDDDCEALCYDCYRDTEHRGAIHDYYYKPEPIFYGEGDRYFGVELEIDGAGEVSSNAQQLLNIANVPLELAYCKHDGSLDDGFEIVTHPITLELHMIFMPWQNVLNAALELGYTSHRARTCGLHVHVNRNTFGQKEEQQDICIARVLYFFEKHWEELLKFSRRTELQLKRWAARYGYKEQPMEILDHAKKGYGGGRYSCINLQNRDTIEFRIFRGTLKYSTLIATLQLVNRVCDVAFMLSDEEIRALSWTSFVADIKEEDAPELIQYLKERRLYINEPVDAEEDD